jgi:hypothetical protein
MQQFFKQEHIIRIRDDDGRPQWLTHPARCRCRRDSAPLHR